VTRRRHSRPFACSLVAARRSSALSIARSPMAGTEQAEDVFEHYHHQGEGAFACAIKDIVAGSARGIAQVVSGHPLDTIKVRLQTQPLVSSTAAAAAAAESTHSIALKYGGPFDCIAKTFAEEGVRWWRSRDRLHMCTSTDSWLARSIDRRMCRCSASTREQHRRCLDAASTAPFCSSPTGNRSASSTWTRPVRHTCERHASLFAWLEIDRFVSAAIRPSSGRNDLMLKEWLQVGATTGGAAAFIEGPIDVAKSKMQVQYQLDAAHGADRVTFTRYKV